MTWAARIAWRAGLADDEGDPIRPEKHRDLLQKLANDVRSRLHEWLFAEGETRWKKSSAGTHQTGTMLR